jgi:hypothetical protein
VGTPYSTQLTATGGSRTGYTFMAAGLPAGLTLSSKGLLSGTPTSAAGSPVSFTVTVTDSLGTAITTNYTLTIVPGLLLTPTTLPGATVGILFGVQFTATGGSGSGYAFTATRLPSWLTLSSSGLLSGTPPSMAGPFVTFTVTVTDSDKLTHSTNYTLSINPGMPGFP